jgi:integrase
MPKLKKRADGRYRKAITDPVSGKVHYFYGKSEREVNLKMMEYQQKKASGRSFAEIADEWWDEAEPDLAVQSVSGYRAALSRAVEYFSDQLIKDITPLDISKYLDTLAKKGFAQKTVAKAKMVCNLIFKHAVINGDLEYNKCADVPLPKNLPKAKRRAASSEDEQLIRAWCEDEWIFPYIALLTGLRKGEILALQWKDIDFERNLISVTKSVAHDGDRAFIKAPKTEEGIRVVPLLEPLKQRFLKTTDRYPEHYIVSNNGGKSPLNEMQYQRRYKSFKKRTGITATAHELRHSFATVAIENGVQAKTVQQILGHKQLSTTMDIYTDLREKSLNEAAQILNAVNANNK